LSATSPLAVPFTLSADWFFYPIGGAGYRMYGVRGAPSPVWYLSLKELNQSGRMTGAPRCLAFLPQGTFLCCNHQLQCSLQMTMQYSAMVCGSLSDISILIDRPCARRGEFDQMAVRVSKVEAPASQFPLLLLLFHCDSFLVEPRLPVGQLVGWDSERDV
jgi:hypothetical protein